MRKKKLKIMTSVIQDIKVGDVFHVRYTQSYRESQKGSDLNHCFEGLAVAMEGQKGVILVDTFWGINRASENKWFTMGDVGKKIEIEFYCNLNDITKIHNLETKYYADEDIIFLHDQHACTNSCKYYYIKNGAVRNKEKMIRIAEQKIAEAEAEITCQKNSIAWQKKILEDIESGRPLTEIYI